MLPVKTPDTQHCYINRNATLQLGIDLKVKRAKRLNNCCGFLTLAARQGFFIGILLYPISINTAPYITIFINPFNYNPVIAFSIGIEIIK